MSFRGSAPAKLDDRGRLKIPAAFREFFKSAPEVFVTRRRGPVLLYPLSTFLTVEGHLKTQGGLDETSAEKLRELNKNGQQLSVDAQGRVTLSQDLRERSQLTPGTELRIVGMSDYLEVWSEEELARQEQD